ncbi:MAG: DUF2344 domain-containing protein [Clostridia bacterium]|nr:DUF2344 domain-containing protein [Clostridia bacterium]
MRNVRIFYEKKGRMKFVSHLDMNRFMSRLIAKSKIPVWFTEGFNQHAYMNFAVPLSLGYVGLYEVMDVKITDDNYPLEKLVEALNTVSTPDINFVKAAESVMHTKEIAFAEFKLSFDNVNAEKINEFFANESIITQKKTKKGGIKDIDIAPLIKKAELCGNELTLILTAGNENNLNPSLVMTAFYDFCGVDPDFYDVTRVMIYDKNLNKFE